MVGVNSSSVTDLRIVVALGIDTVLQTVAVATETMDGQAASVVSIPFQFEANLSLAAHTVQILVHTVGGGTTAQLVALMSTIDIQELPAITG